MKALVILDTQNKNFLSKDSKTPNALVNFFNKPILEYNLNLLKKHNIIEIAILAKYSDEDIKSYFQDGSDFGVNLSYFNDKTSMNEIKKFFSDENFLVTSGTFLTNINLYEAIESHNKKQCLSTVIVTNSPQVVDATVVQCEKDNEVTSFLAVTEQPEKFPKNISTGIFILESEVLDYTTAVPNDILQFLLEENIECFATEVKGSWFGLGILEQYLSCNKVFGMNLTSIVDVCEAPQIKFTNDVIMGNCSKSLTPAVATKIGEIFGCKNSIIGVFTDDYSASDMISSALISGLKSVGTTVYEISATLSPLCKSACSYYALSKGVFIYSQADHTIIEFLDKDGSSIDLKAQKEIEELLTKNETRYVSPSEIPKSTLISNYKFHYYAEMIKRLNDDPIQGETNIILEKTSEAVLEYIRKIAICYKVNLIPTKNASNYTCMKINIRPSGKKLTLWDETGSALTEKQIEAITAKILIDEKIITTYIASPHTSQAVKSMFQDARMGILEVSSNSSSQTKAMLKSIDKEQFLMTNDPIYFVFKLINYLNKNKIKLKSLINALPKTFFIEKTIKTKNGPASIDSLAATTNDETEIIDGGIKINSKKGYTIIMPNKESSSYKISTESANEEYAKELTDFYTNSLL
jgi:NDP-sugar pyrophosphorylase family protein